jgi:hypothetical protein
MPTLPEASIRARSVPFVLNANTFVVGRYIPFPVTVFAVGTSLPAVAAPVTVNEDNVPTEVKLEAVTPDANVVPVKVPAAAVTVISPVPLKLTPLMFRAV